MELHNLRPASGAVKTRKRIARGQGSGYAGTAGRGHKGDGSRSGAKEKRGFEGGQMPMQRRLPKKGFKSPNRIEFVPINVGRLQDIADKYGITTIDLNALVENGIVGHNDRVKILASGELKTALNVTAHACSEQAKHTIEQKGGTVNLV